MKCLNQIWLNEMYVRINPTSQSLWKYFFRRLAKPLGEQKFTVDGLS